MSNKSQSSSSPACNHTKICLQKRRPSVRTARAHQLPNLQRINQNGPEEARAGAGVPPDVFVIVSSETDRGEIVLSLSSLLAAQREGPAPAAPPKNGVLPGQRQAGEEAEVAQLQRSLIEELLSIDTDHKASPTLQTKKLRLQQLDIIETQSFQEEDSSLFDAHSEAVELTEEEQQFFTNFIIMELQKPIEEEGHRTETKRQIQNSSNATHSTGVLEERKRVIRNFFRPKASFFKDDKTRCNSSTNLDEISDSSNRNSFSPSRQEGQKCGIKSSRLLSPFIE